jgi:hypothetical protein
MAKSLKNKGFVGRRNGSDENPGGGTSLGTGLAIILGIIELHQYLRDPTKDNPKGKEIYHDQQRKTEGPDGQRN